MASRAERIPFDVRRINLDIDGIIHKRIYKYGTERGLTLPLCIERRDADKTVNSGLGLEVSIGVVPFKLYGSGLYADLIPLEQFGHGHLVAVPLSPTHVHTHKHGAPVIGFSPPGSGIDGQHRSQRISLLAQHVPELQILHEPLRICKSRVRFLTLGIEFQQNLHVIHGSLRGIIRIHP